MEKPKVLMLSTQCGDWEQLWINGELMDEGHEVRKDDIWKLGNKHGFGPDDIQYQELDDEDEEDAMNSGCLPKNGFEKYYGKNSGVDENLPS